MQAPDHFAIETRSLKKTYAHGKQPVLALNGLNLAVPAHSIFGFLGPNGAGKTTTMKLLLGLARPTEGSVRIFGMDIHQNPAIRARIGYMPQTPRFYPRLTARQTLRFAARFYPQCSVHALEQRVTALLELVGLQDRADRPVGGFSGGERQRLGLAQAQIHQPDLLILDEPAAALDPLGRHDVLGIMERLREQTTIFYSTHILDDVQQVSDTVAILKNGALVAQGSIRALLGGGAPVYRLQFVGPAEPIRTDLQACAWVSQVDPAPADDPEHAQHCWDMVVRDEPAAQAGILAVLSRTPGVRLVEFSRKEAELEEIFVSLVRGGA